MLLSYKNRLLVLLFSGVILSSSIAEAQLTGSAAGDCAGYCGFQSPAGCWCDSLCIFTADCCDDRCDHCSSELNNCNIPPPSPYDTLQLVPPAWSAPDESCVMDVFDDSLNPDWEDWSYFSDVFMHAKKSFQGIKAIKLKLQSFGAFRLHAKIDMSAFDVLEMWISRKVTNQVAMQLGGPPEIDLNIIFGVFPQPKFIDAIANYEQGSFSDSILEWRKYSVPIPKDLGLIKDVILQNPTGGKRKYFLDSITIFVLVRQNPRNLIGSLVATFDRGGDRGLRDKGRECVAFPRFQP